MAEPHVPLPEASALGLRVLGPRTGLLAAVGDRRAVLAVAAVEHTAGHGWRPAPGGWSTIPLAPPLDGEHQWEGIALDGTGRFVLIREAPPAVAVIDAAGTVIAPDIALTLPPGHALRGAWADGSSGPEGLVLLAGGAVLIAKEKSPAALIEFAQAGTPDSHAARRGWLPADQSWEIPDGPLTAVATWLLDPPAGHLLGDISDAATGPDGELYLLSDRSATLARVTLGPLDTGGTGPATVTASWPLGGDCKDAEGLAILPDGTVLVAMDRRHPRDNLLFFPRLLSA
jgi:uncharacterized protein YjiK